jgi:hypothetical protein
MESISIPNIYALFVNGGERGIIRPSFFNPTLRVVGISCRRFPSLREVIEPL